MKFSEAIEVIRTGGKVRRPDWAEGASAYMFGNVIVVSDGIEEEEWIPRSCDLLAMDWEEQEEEEEDCLVVPRRLIGELPVMHRSKESGKYLAMLLIAAEGNTKEECIMRWNAESIKREKDVISGFLSKVEGAL